MRRAVWHFWHSLATGWQERTSADVIRSIQVPMAPAQSAGKKICLVCITAIPKKMLDNGIVSEEMSGKRLRKAYISLELCWRGFCCYCRFSNNKSTLVAKMMELFCVFLLFSLYYWKTMVFSKVSVKLDVLPFVVKLLHYYHTM